MVVLGFMRSRSRPPHPEGYRAFCGAGLGPALQNAPSPNLVGQWGYPTAGTAANAQPLMMVPPVVASNECLRYNASGLLAVR